MILCRGDITLRDEVAWGFTMADAAPFMEHLKRDLMFREAVIGFFAGGDSPDATAQDKYCDNCRRAHPDIDCSACSRKIEVSP